MKVLVAGGTGRLGTLVSGRLIDRQVEVRVLARDPRRAAGARDLGCEVVPGDVRDPQSLSGAVRGADVVVSAVQGFAGSGGNPRSVDADGNGNLIVAAEKAGADVVLMSVLGAAADSPMELFRCKYAAEQRLRQSAAPWTIVRATAFLELWMEIVGKGIVLGRGDNPINFVSVPDVADAVVDTVLDVGRRGRALEIVGPQNLSFNDMAAAMREQLGRPTHVHHVPRSLLRLLAPMHRQPRAALVMDTTDMTAAATGGDRRVGRTTLADVVGSHAHVGQPL